jgi:putative transcriptional regulator
MTRHGWFSTSGDTKLLYDVDADRRWAKGFETAGVDPRLLANSTGTA